MPVEGGIDERGKSHMKRCLQVSALLWLVVLVLPLRAESTEDLLKLQIAAYELEASVSYFSLQQGDSRTEARLDEVLSRGNALAAGLILAYPQIAKLWNNAAAFTVERKASAASGEDVMFPRHFDQVKLPLYAALDKRVAAANFSGMSVARLKTYQALQSLEKITGAYLFFNISFFGGLSASNVGIIEENERFKQLVDEIGAKKSARKWHYLEKTILAYNERSAVFIVVKTTDKIRELLQARL